MHTRKGAAVGLAGAQRRERLRDTLVHDVAVAEDLLAALQQFTQARLASIAAEKERDSNIEGKVLDAQIDALGDDARADVAVVVVGAQDELSPPAIARAMAAALPGAVLVEVPGAGHMTPIENPEPVAAALTALVHRAG